MSLLTAALNRRAGPSNPGPALSPSATSLSAVKAAWSQLAERDRKALQIAGVVLGLALGWWWAVEPAWRTTQQAPAARAALTTELQIMRAQADEAAQLRNAPKLDAAQQRNALETATRKLGGSNAAAGRVALQGGSAVVTLTAVKPDALALWLDEVRSTARGRVGELNLARDTPDGSPTWSGRAVVNLQP